VTGWNGEKRRRKPKLRWRCPAEPRLLQTKEADMADGFEEFYLKIS
jgi:hypothetical protein